METFFLSEFCNLFQIDKEVNYTLSIGAKKQEQDTYIPIGKILKGSPYEGKILAISSREKLHHLNFRHLVQFFWKSIMINLWRKWDRR